MFGELESIKILNLGRGKMFASTLHNLLFYVWIVILIGWKKILKFVGYRELLWLTRLKAFMFDFFFQGLCFEITC